MKHSRLSNTGKKCKENKWRIELTEHQLRLMAQCVEDCHRFIAGQTELSNSITCLKHYSELCDALGTLHPFVTPRLGRGASYGWNGGSCPDKNQRKFIAETYYLYREIYHQLTLEAAKHKDMGYNVYLGETLTCDESGEPIKVERIE